MSLHVQWAPAAHLPWLFDRVGCLPTGEFRALEAVDDAGSIRGMVGFDRWTDNAAEMHVALESPWVAKTLLRPAFEALFVRLGRKVALGTVLSSNEKALRFDAGIGFREVHRVKDGHSDGVDLVFMEMRREECRWLTKEEARNG